MYYFSFFNTKVSAVILFTADDRGEFVGFNNSLFLAEREVADRNYALAYYMKKNKCFPKGANIKDCLDIWYQVNIQYKILKCRTYCILFFSFEHRCCTQICYCHLQCCSMEVNCEALAVIGATLANGGVCPISLERVIKPDAVRDVLSLLRSCGFYEYSGQFAFKVRIRSYRLEKYFK